jgi:hypothetical protein
MSDHDPMAYVASEIARWQDAALSLPLPELQDLATEGLGDLAHSLNAFTGAYLANDGHDYDTEAFHRALGEVTRRATVAAIFTLGVNQRIRRSAALS